MILPCFPPSSTWTWIAFVDIINVFHMGLSCPHSYHHIPYVCRVDIQWVLHIFLSQLTFDLFDVTTWQIFLLFLSSCLSFPLWGGEKTHQEIGVHSCQYMGGG